MIKWLFRKKINQKKLDKLVLNKRKCIENSKTKYLLNNYNSTNLVKLITDTFDSRYRQYYQETNLYKALDKVCDEYGENFTFLTLRCLLEDRHKKQAGHIH